MKNFERYQAEINTFKNKMKQQSWHWLVLSKHRAIYIS